MAENTFSRFGVPSLLIGACIAAPALSLVVTPAIIPMPEPTIPESTSQALALDWWRLWAWVAGMLFFWGVLGSWGVRLTGHVTGIFIDRRNRYSLSRLQIVAWTGLVLPTIWIALGSNLFRAAPLADIPELVIDWNLIALMGISLGSFLAAPAVLQVKARHEAPPKEVELAKKRTAKSEAISEDALSTNGLIVVKDSPAHSRLRDLISGEEIGNAEMIDIARVQMLVLSSIVWLYYAGMVIRTMLINEPSSNGLVAQLPAFDETLLAFLLVSNAGYLFGKVSPQSSATRESSARALSKLLGLVERVENRIHQVDVELGAAGLSPVEEQQLQRLRDQLQSLQTKVKALRPKVDAGESVYEALAHLEGQTDAVTERHRRAIAHGVPAVVADNPSAELVGLVKSRLSSRVSLPLSSLDEWTQEDDKALDEFLKKIDITREDLHPSLYRALEEVLDLL